MRSGRIACGEEPVPESRSTPSTVIVEVPAPVTRAPMRARRSATSSTSGSRAAFSITVVPRASVAAKSTFSVPVTVGVGKRIVVPVSRPLARPTRETCAWM